MGRYASNRNFGYGKQMEFAGKNALRDYYGQGHHSTVATHSERWTQFAVWARESGVRDVAKTDNRELATRYAEHVKALVKSGEISVSTAQNRISSVNTTFAALRGDRHVKVSPSEYAGKRSAIRTEMPAAITTSRISAALTELRSVGMNRAAAVLELAQTFNVRREEAIKSDLDRWSREAARFGAINILDGTKGGRTAERWVSISPAQRQALDNAIAARPTGSRNLIAPHERYSDVAIARNSELNRARDVLKKHGLPGYHDARAAYACQRYTAITGYPAPAVAGQRQAPRDSDRQARITISEELGHGRIDVLVSYVGSAR